MRLQSSECLSCTQRRYSQSHPSLQGAAQAYEASLPIRRGHPQPLAVLPGLVRDHRRCETSDPRGLYRRSEEHTSELQSQSNLVCRLLLEKKKKINTTIPTQINNMNNGCSIIHSG